MIKAKKKLKAIKLLWKKIQNLFLKNVWPKGKTKKLFHKDHNSKANFFLE